MCTQFVHGDHSIDTSICWGQSRLFDAHSIFVENQYYYMVEKTPMRNHQYDLSIRFTSDIRLTASQ